MKWKIMIDVIFSSISDIDAAFFYVRENVFIEKVFRNFKNEKRWQCLCGEKRTEKKRDPVLDKLWTKVL